MPRSFLSFFSVLGKSLVLTSVVLASFAPAIPVRAAVWKGYDAQLISMQGPTTLAPGERGEVVVKYKNDGDKPWQVSSGDFVSLYTWNAAKKTEVASAYADGWLNASQPMKLPVTQVGKGGEVTFRFSVRAPMAAGTYSQSFILASENVAWMKDSVFTVSFRVTAPVPTATSAPNAPAATGTSTPAPSAAISTVYAEDASEQFMARVTNQGGISWIVEAEQEIKTTLSFQNTGGTPWLNVGADAVRLIPIDAAGRLRASEFWHPSWSSKEVVGFLPGRVSLGGDVSFSLSLRAPDSAGTYHERFALVTASGKRLKGAVVDLPLTVTPGSGFVATDLSDLEASTPLPVQTPEQSLPSVQLPTNAGLVASVQAGSGQTFELLGNGRKQVTVGWRNTGTTAWTKMGVRIVSSEPWVKASWLMDSTWSDSRPPEATVQIRTAEVGFYSFYVKAPPRKGTYALNFRLFANGQPVQGGDIRLTVKATTDVAIPVDDLPVTRPTTPSTPSTAVTQPPLVAQPLTGDPSTLPAEPITRVGIYQPPHSRMQVTANIAPLEVRLQGSVICQVAKGQAVTVEYQRSNAQYVLTGSGACNGSSSQPYIVRASDGISPMQVSDFVRPSNWISNASDSVFRSQLELRLSKDGKQLWVINELPVEWYLKGIAETSNSSPAQFQRTLLVAARTYAMYHISRGTKHANEYFLVDATLDQLYRGYAIEQRAPTISAAVDATRGQIVTYNGKLAITPYFSRSDGRTRSWGEVWAGGSQYPWLIGVPVPQDQGRTLWGHGVGMSATGALSMANEGTAYDVILKHFYTGIEIRRAYR